MVQAGIWKPAGLEAALTIRTAYTRPDQTPPYADDIGEDGLARYKYRGVDPAHSDNRAFRKAMVAGLPLVYLIGVDRGTYLARHPVWLVADDPTRHEFALAVDEAQRVLDVLARDYVARLTMVRLHQPLFRARVLRAYQDACAMCRLRHPELLDAAHIRPDGHPHPVVPNGLSLCKIHHAVFDSNIIGVRPGLTLEVKARVLAEIDGPPGRLRAPSLPQGA